MHRGPLCYTLHCAVALVLLAAVPAASPGVAAASLSAASPTAEGTPGVAAVTALAPTLDPTIAAARTAEATTYPIPDAEFAEQMLPRLQAAYDREASAEELRQTALAFAREFFRAEPAQVFVCGAQGPVVVNARPAEGYPNYIFTYLFWPDENEGMQWQAFNRFTEPTLSLILHAPPESAYVIGEPKWEMHMVAGGGILGQDHGGAFYLLRVEEGAWRVVWDYTEAVEAGLWATRGSRARLDMPTDSIVLLGAVPANDCEPAFFNETIHRAVQRQFLSLWERLDDEYVRTAGQIVESPMTGLTEFMVALTGGRLDRAAQRVTAESVIGEAQAQGLDRLVAGQWMVMAVSMPRLGRQTLYLAPADDRRSDEWHYGVSMVYTDGRWLVAKVQADPPRPTPVPTETPSPRVTPAG